MRGNDEKRVDCLFGRNRAVSGKGRSGLSLLLAIQGGAFACRFFWLCLVTLYLMEAFRSHKSKAQHCSMSANTSCWFCTAVLSLPHFTCQRDSHHRV